MWSGQRVPLVEIYRLSNFESGCALATNVFFFAALTPKFEILLDKIPTTHVNFEFQLPKSQPKAYYVPNEGCQRDLRTQLSL
jgi:hypothetical protein